MITFRPMLLETVVVLRDGVVIGTIRRYKAHRACQVRVPGILTAAANPGQSTFPTMAAAKAALLAADSKEN